jgi:glycosyltransferase involved in cell wall biosynthesis
MRILQIVPSLSLVYGGPSQMVLGLSGALARAGAEVTIVTTDSNGDVGQAPLDVPLGVPIDQDGYRVIYFRCSPFRRYKFSLELLNWVDRHAADFDIAHIHALFSPVSSFAARTCRRNQLPYILRPLGTLDPADLRKKKQLKQLYAALLERPNLAGAAAVHFTSAQESRISERFGTTPPDLIAPLGVPAAPIDTIGGASPEENRSAIRRELGVTDDRPIVIFLSRIEPKKGLDLLLPALEQLRSAGLAFQFVLAGANPQDPAYEQGIRQQFEASSIADCTSIVGFVTGDRKRAMLQAADVFVLPSYYENFGIAVAEAMVAGIPVVISDQVHIWENVLAAEGGWVAPCDVEALAEQLSQALADPQERRRRGVKGRAYALEHYNWDTIAQQMMPRYRELGNRGLGNRGL